MSKSEKVVADILRLADIEVNGNRPWDIRVINNDFYSRVLKQGTLGLGESYMDGWWECEKLDEFFNRVIRAELKQKIKITPSLVWHYVKSLLFNSQNKKKSSEVIEKHYDLGNDLYEKMLDKRMVYTCAYWKTAKSLDEAQEAKLDLVCRKLGLKPGMKILDIGCGFGSFLKYAAEKYGIEGVGITLSKEQAAYARESLKNLPIEIRIQDYRDIDEKFDAIASIGMFEAVGYKNFRGFMKVAERCLKDDGLFLLHTIGNRVSVTTVNPWINRYIFPNGMLPSLKQISKAIERIFLVEDLHNFGRDYDLTLMEWYRNFDRNWGSLKGKYGERFYRMWKYYLLSCAGAFRARNIQLWQIVLSKKGVRGGYTSVR